MCTTASPPCTRPARTKPRARNLHKQVNYQLDAAGNLISDGLRTFDYDSTNRHTKTTVSKDGEASKITYLHNALGQRVFKSEPQTAQTLSNEAVLGSGFTNWLKRNFSWMVAKAQTNATLGDSYVYADGGAGSASGGLPSYAMLGEYGNGGASSTGRTEYLYLPTDNGQAIPVGIYRGSRFYAVHADHLNTPRLINDDSNKAVWQWPYSAFGDNKPVGILKATTNPAVAFTQDPTTSARLQATNPAITYNPRFPGQYQDTESGMFQNGFRSYMADKGSYSQFDPIGLAGSWNRRMYADENSLTNTDPMGLKKIILLQPTDPNYPAAVNAADDPNTCLVISHGSPSTVNLLNAKQLNDRLNNEGCGNLPVKLNACSTGQGKNSIAEQLSRLRKGLVTAPDEKTWTTPWDTDISTPYPPMSENVESSFNNIPNWFKPGSWLTFDGQRKK